MKLTVNGIPKYKGVSYSCPICGSVLSVAMDPVALEADIAARVVRLLKSRQL